MSLISFPPKKIYKKQSFYPLQPVLVRNTRESDWRLAFFETVNITDNVAMFVTTQGQFRMCIPFEGHEDYVGTFITPRRLEYTHDETWDADKIKICVTDEENVSPEKIPEPFSEPPVHIPSVENSTPPPPPIHMAPPNPFPCMQHHHIVETIITTDDQEAPDKLLPPECPCTQLIPPHRPKPPVPKDENDVFFMINKTEDGHDVQIVS